MQPRLKPQPAVFVIAALSLLLLTACQGKQGTTVLKMAHGLDTNHPVHKAIEFMAQRLQALSGDTMQMDIYPGAQLGGERELMELLQIGSIALTKVSASPLESFAPEFKVFSLPYVFRDEAHYWRVLEGELGRELLHAAEPVRLRGLGFYDAGSRSFYTTGAPINNPGDLRGKKIRVQNSITSVAMIRALGGSATPIPWAEVYTALQQGVVDGAENNPPSYFLSKHYEVARYLALDEHTYVPDILLVSLPIWRKLTPRQQAWLQQAAAESVSYQRQLWREATEAALAALAAAGVTIVTPDKAPFREAVEPMLRGYAGTAVGDFMERINAAP